MRRREFTAGLFAGVAVSLPRAGRAQQADRVRRIGLLSGFTEEEMRPLLDAFRKRLVEDGWTEGRNVIIDARLTAGDTARLGAEAAALVAADAAVIVAQGTPAVAAVAQHSRTLPIVFTFVADPVSLGLVESLAKPGGQLTGFTNFEYSIGGKWLELLKEIDPRLGRVAVLINARNPGSLPYVPLIEQAGRALSVGVSTAPVRDAGDIENAITALAEPGSGLIVLPDSLAVSHRHRIIELAARHRVPAAYPTRNFTSAGGLMSYGVDWQETYRQAAGYVDRILRGANPAELPVQTPTKFELVVNVKSAASIGIVLPPSLLGRADDVIE